MTRTRKTAGVAAALLLALTLALPAALSASAAPVSITNGVKPTGTNGAPVDTHGGNITKWGSYYYWVGQNTNASNQMIAVSIYRSSDLKTWEWRGDALTPASSPELVNRVVERPKIIYNPATSKFVIWMHWDNATYAEARVAVATSSTIDGTYAYQGSFRPLGNESRDMNVFVDTDGSAYLLSSTNDNRDMAVYRMNSSFTNVTTKLVTLWPDQRREAPVVFKRNGVYFFVTSGQSGWSPNQGKYATSTSLTSGWSALKDFGNTTTYRSQPATVLQLGSSFLYLGDRWAGADNGPVNDSTYTWYPMTFSSNTATTLVNAAHVSVDVVAGTVSKID